MGEDAAAEVGGSPRGGAAGSAWRAPLTWWRGLSLQMRDLVIAGLLAVLLLGWNAADGASGRELAIGAVACVGLIWRRTRPGVALTVTTGSLLVGTLDVGIGSGTLLQALVAIYSAISVGRRGLGAAVALGVALAVPALVALRGDPWDQVEVVATTAMLALAVALGLWVQSRRATLASAQERVLRAEQTRELEAARAVAEERLRIARELHDVLGHHVAIINVHAGVAEALLTTKPDQALDALHNVQDATGAVLTELAALVEVLREPGESADRAPAAGLDVLPGLLADVRAAGMEVTETRKGDPWPPRLAPLVDLIAYRTIQECLTNARKHGTGAATLELNSTGASLTIEVSNPIAPTTQDQGPDESPGGHGLIGLRERAQTVGGSFEVTTDGLAFRARAVLPVLAIDPRGSAGAYEEAPERGSGP